MRVVFVISRASSPPEGELIGDILYVPVPEGYRNIVLKTKAMLCLVRIGFRKVEGGVTGRGAGLFYAAVFLFFLRSFLVDITMSNLTKRYILYVCASGIKQRICLLFIVNSVSPA